ncbi:MAG: hypothetical protein RMJ87_00535 [Cytophagales bacterium]|nr:hypothetical protein [Bernardetiaceae bacterium]MDW8203487.1 hypothetical protein [Cytophagales bacterium]
MKIGVILSGCGVYDGSGIHEAIFSLLILERLDVAYECFAPNSDSAVCNPITKELLPQTRNMLMESARIARGRIHALSDFQASTFDGLVIPGSYHRLTELPPADIATAICQIAQSGKPIAATSTAAIWVANALQNIDTPIKITLGKQANYLADTQLAAWANEATLHGIQLVESDPDDFVEDDLNNIITTPGYLGSQSMGQVFEGVEKTINKLVEMVTLVMSS